MKRLETNESARFRGGVRPHHRGGCQTQSSWDQWVAGEQAERPKRAGIKFIWVILILLLLAGGGVVLWFAG